MSSNSDFPKGHQLPLATAFRRLGWSSLLAQSAEQIALAAAPLTAVLLFAATPAEIGWLQTAQTLPFLLFSIPAGLMADRASRRTLMIGAEGLRALALATVVALLLLGALSLPWLALLGFLCAVGTVSYLVAAPAIVPVLVPRPRLADANRWLELARSAAYTAGPALGGIVIGWTGAPAAYSLATVLAVAAVLLLTRLPREARPSQPRRRLIAELREAAVFMAGHRLLRPIFVTAVVFNTAWFILHAIYVAYAMGELGMTAGAVGLTLGLSGIGMIVGALAAPALSRRLPFGTIVVLGPLGGFTGALLVLLTAWMPLPTLAGAGFFLFGAGPVLWTISTTTLRQTVTPNEMLGRVSALLVTATFGARPVGAAIGAGIATLFGPTACLIAAALGFLVQLAVIWLSEVPRLRALPAAA